MNKYQYEKYISTKNIKKINNKDKKFYRKRVLNLTRELLLSHDSSLNLLPDVKYNFDNYVNSCIQYFKIIDSSDIIQEEYKDYISNDLENDYINFEENYTLSNNTDDIDNQYMRSVKIPLPTLKDFVKKNNIQYKKPAFIPQQKDIDLKNPVLKNKGILKKKNKNNIYEETNEKETK
jgi:hypothetical protein